ncbi:MAG: glycerate kinase type-2 family protein [Alphaproteobacteria bacterium]
MPPTGVDQVRPFLRALFQAAVDAAMPDKVVPPHLPHPPRGKTIVLGAGKAAAAMARAVERNWSGDLSGLVVTRYGHAVSCERIVVVEAAHPVPDANGVAAARRILDIARSAGPDDLVLCLISGGGSALLSLPAPGLSLDDKAAINQALLMSGADIGEMNIVRRHLSAIKGGRLAAAAYPAEVMSLLISDVPGDDPATIASGPTVADPSTVAEAIAILERHAIALPDAVRAHLASGQAESPKPGAQNLSRTRAKLIASPMASLAAAADVAHAGGVKPVILGDAIEGEAREVGEVMAGIALSVRRHGHPAPAPVVLLSGGETTVTVRARGKRGKGGRNAEFLAGCALALNGAPGIAVLAADTDGIDGSEDNAGALVMPDTLRRGRELDAPDLREALAGNNVQPYFAALGDLVETGPTLTNVNDFRALLIADW